MLRVCRTASGWHTMGIDTLEPLGAGTPRPPKLIPYFLNLMLMGRIGYALPPSVQANRSYFTFPANCGCNNNPPNFPQNP